MKYTVFVLGIASLFLSLTVMADTTVTVDDNNKVTVVQPSPAVVVQKPAPIIVEKNVDPRQIEGEIVKVDYPKNEMVVRDVEGRERRIDLKPGMINNYKVDDYVQVYLMADMKEAKTIATKRTADLEGDVIAMNYDQNQIVVRDGHSHQTVVILKPGMANNYKIGDRVKLYVVSDSPNFEEAKMIRVH